MHNAHCVTIWRCDWLRTKIKTWMEIAQEKEENDEENY